MQTVRNVRSDTPSAEQTSARYSGWSRFASIICSSRRRTVIRLRSLERPPLSWLPAMQLTIKRTSSCSNAFATSGCANKSGMCQQVRDGGCEPTGRLVETQQPRHQVRWRVDQAIHGRNDHIAADNGLAGPSEIVWAQRHCRLPLASAGNALSLAKRTVARQATSPFARSSSDFDRG